ncbi:hypothetical protein [Azospirillum argentinense]
MEAIKGLRHQTAPRAGILGIRRQENDDNEKAGRPPNMRRA